MKIKRLTGILTASALLFQLSVGAAESVDYSAKLSELESLLNECEAMKIPTDYERVNYAVIKRFEALLNEDIANGHSAVDTNIVYMDELYEEAKANLTAYIAGEKQAYPVNRPDMTQTDAEGSVLYSDSQPVFSVGYGHFSMARSDVNDFSDFGVNNIQIEIGPTYMTPDFYGWNENKMGTPDAAAERVVVDGDYVMHITNNTAYAPNVYLRYYKKIDCTPNTKYKFGCNARGDNLDNVWITINDFADRNNLSSSRYWKDQYFYYTTGAEQTSLVFSVCTEGVTDGYLDDFYVYEVNDNNEILSENLVTNPGVEDDDCYSTATNYVIKTLENAERNNVGVCLLLSPHYFPTDLEADIYGEGGFLKYNINAPEAKEVIKNYLDNLLPRLSGYKALDSICLSNEPTFSTLNYYDYYNPLFQEYLESVHKDITALNKRYGTKYTDFKEINMPTDLKNYDAVCYDWIEFNDKTFTDWHKWMAAIVEEYLPGVPIHAKMMGYFATGAEDADRNKLMRGTDLEYFDQFSDYAGNDTWDFMSNINLYYNTMFLYDYQRSVTKKPVYNSEDHIIEDRSTDFTINQRKHYRNNIWMGAAHGRSMSTVWVWDKSTDTTSALYNSIAYRPDVAAESGKTSLDLMRYNFEMARLQQEKPDVAVLYSKPSRLYSQSYSQKLLWTYISLLNMGEKVGVVSDNSIDLLSDYKVLIIPEATNCKENTLNKIEEFINKGGKVIYTGEVLAADEYNNVLDNSVIKSGGDSYSSATLAEVEATLYPIVKNAGLARLHFIDSETGERPENLDWQYSIEGRDVLITVTNLEYNDTKNLLLYADDEQLSGMTECFSGEKGSDTIALEGYTPQLIKVKIPKTLTQEIDGISVDKENKLIKWNYRTDNYFGAKVYSVSDTGAKTFISLVKGNEYNYSTAGTYVVTALWNNLFETEGRIVTVSEELPFEINCINSAISEKSVSAEIEINNITESVNAGVVCTIAYNADGGIVGYAYNKMTLYPSAKDAFKVMFSTDEKAERIEIYAADSVLSKNIYSNVITKSNIE